MGKRLEQLPCLYQAAQNYLRSQGERVKDMEILGRCRLGKM